MTIDSARFIAVDEATLVRVMAMNMTALLTAEDYVCQHGRGISRFCNLPLKGRSLTSLPRVLAARNG